MTVSSTALLNKNTLVSNKSYPTGFLTSFLDCDYSKQTTKIIRLAKNEYSGEIIFLKI